MEDHRLKAFCLVVEMKSFSKAAEAKFMTQSAMSHLIKSLEDEMGVKLLNRHRKTISPTPAGRLFYEHAMTILGEYKKLDDGVHSLMKKVRGPLLIGASVTAASYLLPQVLYNFARLYPEVKIDLSVSGAETIISELKDGSLEIGCLEGNVKVPPLVPEEIAEDEIVVVASDDNPLAREKVIEPGDIISQPFIMPETGSGTRAFINEFLQDNKLDAGRIKIAMTLGSPELILQMVRAGLGISFLSKWVVFKSLQEGSVKVLPLSGKKLKRKFYLITAENSLSIVARTFREFMKKFRFFMPF
jgi:DNA-binding transcriptional LysR family regulator